jgi:hypothetical protein
MVLKKSESEKKEVSVNDSFLMYCFVLLTQAGDGKVTGWRMEGGRRAEDHHQNIQVNIVCFFFTSKILKHKKNLMEAEK